MKLLYSTTRNIERLDEEIACMIRVSDKKKDQLKKLEYQLISLGVSNEKIEIATKHKEVPYMLTEEVERAFIREERKRKREEEVEEAERKKRKREMIVVKDGKVISGGDTGAEVEGEGDTAHVKTLIQQQSDMMKSQEVVIQTQEAQMVELQLKIRQLEAENQKLALEKQQFQEQSQTYEQVIPTPQENVQQFPSLSSLTLPLLDPMALELDPITAAAGTSSSATAGSSTFSLEKCIKPEHRKFLPKFSGVEGKTEEGTSQNLEVINLPQEQSIVYIPKKVEKKKALILVPPTQKRVLTKRSNPGAPVPEDNRDPDRYYCENCACNYKEKSDLRKHQRFMCLKTEFDFICNECQMGFHTDYGVREHYYQVHKKEFLYFCTKCGKGFFHKSKKSNHKKACPKKDEEDTHARRAPYDEELEKTFKRRTRVEVDIPEEVLDLAKQYQAEETKECEEATAALQKELEKDKTVEVVADDDDDSQ